jgi:hypothetical protein
MPSCGSCRCSSVEVTDASQSCFHLETTRTERILACASVSR